MLSTYTARTRDLNAYKAYEVAESTSAQVLPAQSSTPNMSLLPAERQTVSRLFWYERYYISHYIQQ